MNVITVGATHRLWRRRGHVERSGDGSDIARVASDNPRRRGV